MTFYCQRSVTAAWATGSPWNGYIWDTSFGPGAGGVLKIKFLEPCVRVAQWVAPKDSTNREAAMQILATLALKLEEAFNNNKYFTPYSVWSWSPYRSATRYLINLFLAAVFDTNLYKLQYQNSKDPPCCTGLYQT